MIMGLCAIYCMSTKGGGQLYMMGMNEGGGFSSNPHQITCQ